MILPSTAEAVFAREVGENTPHNTNPIVSAIAVTKTTLSTGTSTSAARAWVRSSVGSAWT